MHGDGEWAGLVVHSFRAGVSIGWRGQITTTMDDEIYERFLERLYFGIGFDWDWVWFFHGVHMHWDGGPLILG